MSRISKSVIALVVLCLLAIGPAWAATNYWVDPGGGYSANYNDATRWSLGVPNTTDTLAFTNSQHGSPYTVSFTNDTVNGPFIVGVQTGWPPVATASDSVIFDLQGYSWTSSNSIALSAATNVTFTSTSGGQGTVFTPGALYVGQGYGGWNRYNSVTISNVNVVANGGQTDIQHVDLSLIGAGAQLTFNYGGYYAGLGGQVDVADGAKILYGGAAPMIGNYVYNGSYSMLTTIRNGSTLDNNGAASFTIGWGTAGALQVLTNSTWNTGNIFVGGLYIWGYAGQPYFGDVLVDNSTVVGQGLVIGNGTAGRVVIQNGSTVTLSNGNVMVNAGNNGANTNMLVVNNSTILLGPAGNGALTNRGILRASGTITGLGASPGLVRIEAVNGSNGLLEVGSSIGTLTLNNLNLELGTGTETLFEFSDTGLDQIILNGGSASVLGSNVFTLVGGSAPLGPYKYGLGAYDFVVGDTVTWSPQYDDLTNILTSAGLVQGLHYNYGIFNIGGGLQALRLEFVPEPSTVMLLLGGGLVLWRFRRRRS